MARWITGEEPISVFCAGTAFLKGFHSLIPLNLKEIREAGDIDAVVVVLRFPSGAIVSIDNHRRAMYGYDQRMEIHSSKGQFQTMNKLKSTVVVFNEKGIRSDNTLAGN
jgi:myo-inositol 2-dehydrogenase/D-chiro-inositol 1-dehydrogenase